MKAQQAVWLFIALMGLACSGWYFASTPVKIKWNTDRLSTTTDMTIHQLTVHQFNSEGQLANHLQTPLMRHQPSKDTYDLKTPHIIVIQYHQPAWQINAQSATALYGGEKITFEHHVVLHQDKGARNEASTFKTETITYFPHKKQAITTDNITYEREDLTVTAKGMMASLAEKHVQLTSNVRARYQPKEKKTVFLQAGHADLNQQTHIGHYTHHVQLTQDTTHIEADNATTEGDDDHQLIKATINGDKTKRAHYWTIPTSGTLPLHAYANTMIYYPERHLIELIGDAHVEQGQDSFSAPKIRYDTKHQHVLSNDKQTPTAIIIHPRQHS